MVSQGRTAEAVEDEVVVEGLDQTEHEVALLLRCLLLEPHVGADKATS